MEPTFGFSATDSMDVDMMDSAGGDEQQENKAWMLASNIHKRCSLMLQEIARLEAYMDTNSTQLDPEMHLEDFKNDLRTEKRRMEKFGELDPTWTNESYMTKLEATNQIFDEALWAVAKTCEDVMAVNQFCIKTPGGVDRAKIKIDIVAESGREWVKVSTSTEKRIMWDIIKAGYHASEDMDEDDDDDDDYNDEVSLVVCHTPMVQE